MKKFISMLMVALMATSVLALTACGGDDTAGRTLTLANGHDNITLVTGETFGVEYTTNFSAPATFRSADTNIIEVVGATLIAKNLGATTVTLSTGGLSKAINVKVIGVVDVEDSIEFLLFDESLEALNAEYASAAFVPEFRPALASFDTLTIVSSNEDVVTVEIDEGEVILTAVAVGTATITYTDSAKYNGQSREVKVQNIEVVEAVNEVKIDITVTTQEALNPAYQSLYMPGTFNGWGGPIDDRFLFTPDATGKIHKLTLFIEIDDSITTGTNHISNGAGTEEDPIIINFRNLGFKIGGCQVGYVDGEFVKYQENWGWTYEEKGASDIEYTLGAASEIVLDYQFGSFAATIPDPDADKTEITFTIELTLPNALRANYDIWVFGSMNGWNFTNDYKMTPNGARTVFTVEITVLTATPEDEAQFLMVIIPSESTSINWDLGAANIKVGPLEGENLTISSYTEVNGTKIEINSTNATLPAYANPVS